MEKATFAEVFKSAEELRKDLADKRSHIVTVPKLVVIEQCKLEMAYREGYDSFNGDFKEGLKDRFGGSDTPWTKLNTLIETEVPKFVDAMFNSLKKESQKKKSSWEILWILPKNPTSPPDKFIVEASKRKQGASVFKAFKGEFKQRQQKPLIAAINGWSDSTGGGQGRDAQGRFASGGGGGGKRYSRRGEHFSDTALNRRIGDRVPIASGGYQQAPTTIRTKGQTFRPKEGTVYSSKKRGLLENVGGTFFQTLPGGSRTQMGEGWLPQSVANDPFVDLGHDEGSSVSGTRKAMMGEFLENWPGMWGGQMGSLVLGFMKDNGVQFNIDVKKSVAADMEVKSHCEWQSAGLNRRNPDVQEKDNLNQEFRTAVLKAIEHVTKQKGSMSLAEFEASDSMNTMIEKKVIEALVGPLRKNKGIRVQTRLKNMKLKNSRTEHRGKKRKQRVKVSSLPYIKPKKATVMQATRGMRKSKSSPAHAPLFLLGVLQEQLPTMVQNNMGEPALTNRTGRFASSVRATDMAMTPQGFPSIGYTYRRDPYETFEQDSNYDPRKLIDRSIREIAAEYAMGRFYTRRV